MTDRRRHRAASWLRLVEHARRWRPAPRVRAWQTSGEGADIGLGVEALSELFDDAPFGFAVLDERGRFRLVNQWLAAVDGLAAADHLGQKPAELALIGAVDQDCVDRVLRTGMPGLTANTTVPDPASGIERYLVTSCYPVRDRSGRVAATVTSDPSYVTSSVDLEGDERIVLFTDGLIERRGEPIDEGLSRLAEHALVLRHGKLEDCVESLLAIVDEQFDDLAVICAELVGADQ